MERKKWPLKSTLLLLSIVLDGLLGWKKNCFNVKTLSFPVVLFTKWKLFGKKKRQKGVEPNVLG